ncbi:MAG: histidine kinase [Alphaproteobacteria bacterium]|nr:histidine kinase [Alphaproteobacteria bacterium]
MTLAIVGTGILVVRLPQIVTANQTLVDRAAEETASRIEVFLKGLEERVALVAQTAYDVPDARVGSMLDAARGDAFEALYLVNKVGTVVAISVGNVSAKRSREMVGIDLSNSKLVRAVAEKKNVVWSDKFLSAVTGIVTIGVAIPIERFGGVVIAELPLATLLKISHIARGAEGLEFWIIDGHGEVVADTGLPSASGFNLRNNPVVKAGLAQNPVAERMTFKSREYQSAASFSRALGWLFVSRIPAGLENRRIRETVGLILIAFIASPLIGLILAPFWARGMTEALAPVIQRARMIASGAPPGAWPRGNVVEFNQLTSDLEAMSKSLQQRQLELRDLNEGLEARVEQRTQDLAIANDELTETLSTLNRAQGELVHSEKMAALGRLVAGVAHELNTPIGIGRMAVSTMRDAVFQLEKRMKTGLRKSDLTNTIEHLLSGSDMAEKNMIRAADLISSFKQVAVDRTTSNRRRFQLLEIVDEIILTLTPIIKQKSIRVDREIPKDIILESYPGDLGQVLTNLIDNAIKHGFDKRDNGVIRISAAPLSKNVIRLTISDDGHGMTKGVIDKIFDPFFTTKRGCGGTGLGMHVTYNAVVSILGGAITVSSTPDEGSVFQIDLPLIGPNRNIA